MTVKERLKEFINFKDISVSEFCRQIGVSSAFVSSMRKSIQPVKTESIALRYPELNITWLLTGEGEMLNSTGKENTGNVSEILVGHDVVTVSREAWDMIKMQIETIQSQQCTIELLTTQKIQSDTAAAV